MSTTIYQIHEYSGEYEDYEDVVVGSYFHKSDAKAKMKELELQAKNNTTNFIKCQNCPSNYSYFDDNDVKKIKQYCTQFELSVDDENDDNYCINTTFNNDDPTYEIVEVEVN